MTKTQEVKMVVRLKFTPVHPGECVIDTVDLTEVLGQMDVSEIQELLDEAEMLERVLTEGTARFGKAENARVLGEKDDSYEPDLKAYILHRLKLDSTEERERAAEAMVAFEQAGGETYVHGFGDKYLSVDVKCYDCCSVPEFKEDENCPVDDWERGDFWEYDINDDIRDNSDKHFGEHAFPKCYGLGRSGGHLCFRETSYLVDALKADGAENAVHEFEPTVIPEDYDTDIDDLRNTYVELAEWFESATKWVEFVKAAMANRIKNVQGKHRDWLDCQVDNLRYELFDYSECTITLAEGEATISWPQHERVFEDAGGEWEPCEEGDEGATKFTGKVSKEGIDRTVSYKKWIPAGVQTFSFTVDKGTLVEILAPEVATAQAALAAIGK